MQKVRCFILFLILFLCFSPSSYAVDEPSSLLNNKFGIHLAVPDDRDLDDAAKLVNSNKGQWGYVTVVIQEGDRDINKWQEIFDKMRRLHLIPIVRLATSPEGAFWRRPVPEQAIEWADFLNSLNWVIKNRYITLFNEPNHGTEWGGEVNPEGYADVAYAFAKELKERDPDFFIMLAGFDQVAPRNPPTHLDEAEYIARMLIHLRNQEKNIEDYLDGLSSHAYPNPAFSGRVTDFGRGSIRGYEWEKEYLRILGLGKDLPVFITETGWVRGDALSEEEVAARFVQAYENVWLIDESVKAVTPFILNYQGAPFLPFSWRKLESEEFYEQYRAVQKLEKVKAEPEQITGVTLLTRLPSELVAGSRFTFIIKLKNTGQSIWDPSYEPALFSDRDFFYYFSPLPTVEPGGEWELTFHIKTPETIGKHIANIVLLHRGKKVSNNAQFAVNVVPNIDFNLSYSLFLRPHNEGNDFTVEIYDSMQKIVYKKEKVSGKKGILVLEKVKNVAINERYRVVLLKPGYLPRQQMVKISKDTNFIHFKPHLPLDWNRDGKWSISDLIWFMK